MEIQEFHRELDATVEENRKLREGIERLKSESEEGGDRVVEREGPLVASIVDSFISKSDDVLSFLILLARLSLRPFSTIIGYRSPGVVNKRP